MHKPLQSPYISPNTSFVYLNDSYEIRFLLTFVVFVQAKVDIFNKGIDEITREITKTNVAIKSSAR